MLKEMIIWQYIQQYFTNQKKEDMLQYFPDFDYGATEGKTLEQAMEMAKKQNLNFSQILQNALKQELEIEYQYKITVIKLIVIFCLKLL